MIDEDVLEQVLQALARGSGGQVGQRAWMTLPSMTARICGRFSKEARAVATARAGDKPDPVGLSDVAALLTGRARTDPRFASILVPWLAAARMLLAAEDGIVHQAHENRDREGSPGPGTVAGLAPDIRYNLGSPWQGVHDGGGDDLGVAAGVRDGQAAAGVVPGSGRCFPACFPVTVGIQETLPGYPFCAVGCASDACRLRPGGRRGGPHAARNWRPGWGRPG